MSKLILYTSEQRVHVPHCFLPFLARIYFLWVLTLHLSLERRGPGADVQPAYSKGRQRGGTNSEGYHIIFTKLALLLREPGITAQTATGGPENLNAVWPEAELRTNPFGKNHRMRSIRNKSSYFSRWKKGGTFWKTTQRILLKIDSELGQVPTRLQC